MKNYYLVAMISLGLNIVLMFCLFSPDIMFFIHKRFIKILTKSSYIEGAKDYCNSPLTLEQFIKKQNESK